MPVPNCMGPTHTLASASNGRRSGTFADSLIPDASANARKRGAGGGGGGTAPQGLALGLAAYLQWARSDPAGQLLERVPVGREIKAALLGLPSRAGAVLELARAQESGDWSRCAELGLELRISEEEVSGAYLDSVRWAREVSRA